MVRGRESATRRGESDRATPAAAAGVGTDRLFWVLMLGVAIAVYAFGLRPALEERRRSREELARLRRDVDTTRSAVLRKDLESQGLQSDPHEVERRLRNQGYTLPGEVRLVPANSEDAQRPTQAPRSGR